MCCRCSSTLEKEAEQSRQEVAVFVVGSSFSDGGLGACPFSSRSVGSSVENPSLNWSVVRSSGGRSKTRYTVGVVLAKSQGSLKSTVERSLEHFFRIRSHCNA